MEEEQIKPTGLSSLIEGWTTDKITGAGVFLWEYTRLTDEEYKRKQALLNQSHPLGEGYTILLFGQKEKSGKYINQILYSDPGGKIDKSEKLETSQAIASRELLEESCGLLSIDESHFDIKKSFRMGGTYILYNILLESGDKQNINLNDFDNNYKSLKNLTEETPTYWLESQSICRVFIQELNSFDLKSAQHIFNLNDIYGNQISIGRRCIAILKSLMKSTNVYNFNTNKILINTPVKLNHHENKNEKLLQDFQFLRNTMIYESIQ